MKRQLALLATQVDHSLVKSVDVNYFVNTMRRVLPHWLARTACVFAVAATAGSSLKADDRELHVIGIYQAGDSTSNHSEGVASVEVNRPGKSVTLLLSSYEPVLWQIHVDAGTIIEKIIATGYYRQRVQGIGSDVSLVTQSYDEGTGYLYIGSTIDSAEFLSSVPKIHALTGLEISSFHGGYSQASSSTFLIDSTQDDARLRSDYPQPVPIEQLPDLHFELSFQRDNGVVTQSYTLAGPQNSRFLLPSGMRVISDAGKRFYYGGEQQRVIRIDTLTGTVEEIPAQLTAPEGWPMGTAFDSSRNRILVVNLSGEGGLYGYSAVEDRWSFLASMQNRDFDSIEYRAADDSLYVVGLTHDSAPVVHQLRADGTYVGTVATLPMQPFNIEPGGARSEIVAVGDHYLVVLLGPQSWYNHDPADYRMYLIDLRNGQVQLTYRQVGTPPNNPPTVRITAPDDGTTVEVGAQVQLDAEASDSDGTVKNVEFFANGQSIGFGTLVGESMAASPMKLSSQSLFAKKWAPSSPGEFVLTARATDAEGGAGVSDSVHITVHGNQRPVVRISSPPSGSSFPAGVVVTLKAEASDPDGKVQSVEFLVNGISLGKATSSSDTLFSQDWTTPANGAYMIAAKATDGDGASATSNPIQIIVRDNRAPIVRITSPTNGSTLRTGAKTQLVAEAFDFDGSVKSVEFFANDQSIGSGISLGGIMFRLEWTNPAPGDYSLTAKATDIEGASKVSGAVQVTVVDAPIVVTRQLPKFYRPGGKLRARLLVEPGLDVQTYIVEDRPPEGWIVSRISQGGTFDAATGLVKFGPFTDARRRVLGYQLTIPDSATGPQTFSGKAVADDVEVAIRGDQTIDDNIRKAGIEGVVYQRSSLLLPVEPWPVKANLIISEIIPPNGEPATRPPFVWNGTTDDKGNFHVATPPGRFRVIATRFPQPGDPTIPSAVTMVEVTVVPGTFTRISIYLVPGPFQPPPPAGTGIRGLVLADVPGPRAPQPLANAPVQVDEIRPLNAPASRPALHWAGKTNAEGRFEVSTYAGRYRVTARQLDSTGQEFGTVTIEVTVQDGAFNEIVLLITHNFV